MLRFLVEKLISPCVHGHNSILDLHVFEDGSDGHIRHGILVCRNSRNWFPIEDDILELVHPDLMYGKDRISFYNRFETDFIKAGIPADIFPSERSAEITNQQEQRDHYDDFIEDRKLNYDAYESLPFWQAMDQKVFGSWRKIVLPGSELLDVGCGNGRSALRMSGADLRITGIDISKKSVKRAIERSRENGLYSSQCFFVADANRLPFKSNCFDYAITSGVLSQIPDPGTTTREILQILKPGGIYFGLENNLSIFRKVFDVLVSIGFKWKPNKKGLVPEISLTMLKEWSLNIGHVSSYTSVFIPPSVFNFFKKNQAGSLIKFSDMIFNLIPGFKGNGGLIIFQIQKKS